MQLNGLDRSRLSCAGATRLSPYDGCGLVQPVGEEALFWLGLCEVERPAAGVVGLAVAAGATQELSLIIGRFRSCLDWTRAGP
jgi:hypothetical protein